MVSYKCEQSKTLAADNFEAGYVFTYTESDNVGEYWQISGGHDTCDYPRCSEVISGMDSGHGCVTLEPFISWSQLELWEDLAVTGGAISLFARKPTLETTVHGTLHNGVGAEGDDSHAEEVGGAEDEVDLGKRERLWPDESEDLPKTSKRTLRFCLSCVVALWNDSWPQTSGKRTSVKQGEDTKSRYGSQSVCGRFPDAPVCPRPQLSVSPSISLAVRFFLDIPTQRPWANADLGLCQCQPSAATTYTYHQTHADFQEAF